MSNHHNQDSNIKKDKNARPVNEHDKEAPGSKVESNTEVNRRDFLTKVSGGALGIAAVGGGIVTVKYVTPNVLFEPPSRFRIGPPSNFPVNTVNTFQEQLTYVVRVPKGFYAQTMICQHLGCITQWNPDDKLIECPCHGSEYKMDGAIARGPTVHPLYHYPMRLMPDGTLQVDKSKRCPMNQILKV